MPWPILAAIVIVASAAAIIALERWRPYDRGQPFLRDGFWVDLVTYALFQSYFLALVINLLITWIDGWTGASRYGLVSGWPIDRLQWVINGPEMHRWHHAIDHPQGGSNFGTKAIWDWIFAPRTGRGEAGRLRARRGVPAGLPGAARVRVPAVRAVRPMMLLR
jgi:hypothetical protein